MRILLFALLLILAACQAAEVETEASATPLVGTTDAPTATDEPRDTPLSTPEAESTVAVPTAESAQTTPTPTPHPPPPTKTPAPEVAREVVPADSISLRAVVTEGLTRPVYLTHANDRRLFVVEQAGAIRIIEDGQLLAGEFLNISSQIDSSGNEQGLLGLAFPSDFGRVDDAAGRSFYVYYTNLGGDTVVSRYSVSQNDPNKAELDSEQILLEIEQPYGNHNGGQLQFGPDGYLYIGLGDGGSANDPLEHGQNLSTLLGAMLRLDVSQTSGDTSYAIPESNPFVDTDGVLPEIWAYGLRNPWRFSFDRLKRDLYVADVGQDLWEELNFQPADSGGGQNYGWNITEGTGCFNTADCDAAGQTLPVFEYDHSQGCSITGGYVYRGDAYPALWGNYFTADFCQGTIWRVVQGPDGLWSAKTVLSSGLLVSSFGEDVNGELYVLDLAGGVYQIID